MPTTTTDNKKEPPTWSAAGAAVPDLGATLRSKSAFLESGAGGGSGAKALASAVLAPSASAARPLAASGHIALLPQTSSSSTSPSPSPFVLRSAASFTAPSSSSSGSQHSAIAAYRTLADSGGKAAAALLRPPGQPTKATKTVAEVDPPPFVLPRSSPALKAPYSVLPPPPFVVPSPLSQPLSPLVIRYSPSSVFTSKVELYRGSISTIFSARCAATGRSVVLKEYDARRMRAKHFARVTREREIMTALGGGRGVGGVGVVVGGIEVSSSLVPPLASPSSSSSPSSPTKTIEPFVPPLPGVVRLYGAFDDRAKQRTTLVVESCSRGDLFRALVLARGGGLGPRYAATAVVAPLLRTLVAMHSRGIVHRDIKPENLFVGDDGVVKLGDFGLAIDASSELPFSRSGTLDYMSPEVLANPCLPDLEEGPMVVSGDGEGGEGAERGEPDVEGFGGGGAEFSVPRKKKSTVPITREMLESRGARPYGPKVDVWAVGVLAYELVTGRPPFEGTAGEVASSNAAANAAGGGGGGGGTGGGNSDNKNKSNDHHHPLAANTVGVGGGGGNGDAATASRVLYSDAIRLPPSLGEEWASFVKLALRKRPSERPTAAELLEHPWLVMHGCAGMRGEGSGGGSGGGGGGIAATATTAVAAAAAAAAAHPPAPVPPLSASRSSSQPTTASPCSSVDMDELEEKATGGIGGGTAGQQKQREVEREAAETAVAAAVSTATTAATRREGPLWATPAPAPAPVTAAMPSPTPSAPAAPSSLVSRSGASFVELLKRAGAGGGALDGGSGDSAAAAAGRGGLRVRVAHYFHRQRGGGGGA